MMKRMVWMKHWLMRVTLFAAVVLWPALALAADEEKPPDARIQNFQKPVTVPEGGTALTWLFLILLTGICLAALFKNARRTHLD